MLASCYLDMICYFFKSRKSMTEIAIIITDDLVDFFIGIILRCRFVLVLYYDCMIEFYNHIAKFECFFHAC